MDIRQLRYFVKVVELENITAVNVSPGGSRTFTIPTASR